MSFEISVVAEQEDIYVDTFFSEIFTIFLTGWEFEQIIKFSGIDMTPNV
ncbi:hypothetical protein [Flammeovirga sp. SJP92]|nr:hypothetical protein [Flammeovirga sp. SJP92]